MESKKTYSKQYKKQYKASEKKAEYKPKRGQNDGSRFTVQGEGLSYKQKRGPLSKLMSEEEKAQLYRSGSSIGANVRESKHAQSDADFLSKMSIAYKEADESDFWLNLLHDNGYLIKEKVKDI